MLLCSLNTVSGWLTVSRLHFGELVLAIDFQRCAADSDWHRQLKSFSFDLNDYFSFFHCWIKTTQPKKTHRIHYPWISFWDKLTVWIQKP